MLSLWTRMVLCAPLLAGTVAHAAEPLTLRVLSAQVEGAADTPHIDAAAATADQICTLNSNPATVQHFHAASISKLFTALVIMQLRDEGALTLDDFAGNYEPAFEGSPIRIRHLLTHTSGLRDRRRADGRAEAAQVDAYITSLASQRSGNSPGTEWRYADAGFNLLGRIIERISGQPFAQVMRERLLAPLGMANSDFDLARIPEDARVQAYSKRGRLQEHPWDLAFLPSSGLQTTAADLALFAQAILKIAQGDSALLSAESLQEMTDSQLAIEWEGITQGYGWQLDTTPQGVQWRHAGGEAGFESLLAIYPERGLGIVVLGNKEDWPRFAFERALRERLLTSENSCGN